MKPLCKIKWFNAKAQRIEEKYFNSYEAAEKWGKKILSNWNLDLIQTIHY